MEILQDTLVLMEGMRQQKSCSPPCPDVTRYFCDLFLCHSIITGRHLPQLLCHPGFLTHGVPGSFPTAGVGARCIGSIMIHILYNGYSCRMSRQGT
ncbi:hypothetical protein GDO81_029301 [Engystomops pustulosus]|uniref:Uncharacterized protein n=1 Tax=Engystomops pustulosus TaxID=76066 RepID=A0AAV6ZL14_ENGPU|nr:hypothetical protein GDO81_029301 [Engystomops pustulosus]